MLDPRLLLVGDPAVSGLQGHRSIHQQLRPESSGHDGDRDRLGSPSGGGLARDVSRASGTGQDVKRRRSVHRWSMISSRAAASAGRPRWRRTPPAQAGPGRTPTGPSSTLGRQSQRASSLERMVQRRATADHQVAPVGICEASCRVRSAYSSRQSSSDDAPPPRLGVVRAGCPAGELDHVLELASRRRTHCSPHLDRDDAGDGAGAQPRRANGPRTVAGPSIWTPPSRTATRQSGCPRETRWESTSRSDVVVVACAHSHEVAATDHAHQVSFFVDDRQALEPPGGHQLGHLGNVSGLANGDRVQRHHLEDEACRGSRVMIAPEHVSAGVVARTHCG